MLYWFIYHLISAIVYVLGVKMFEVARDVCPVVKPFSIMIFFDNGGNRVVENKSMFDMLTRTMIYLNIERELSMSNTTIPMSPSTPTNFTSEHTIKSNAFKSIANDVIKWGDNDIDNLQLMSKDVNMLYIETDFEIGSPNKETRRNSIFGGLCGIGIRPSSVSPNLYNPDMNSTTLDGPEPDLMQMKIEYSLDRAIFSDESDMIMGFIKEIVASDDFYAKFIAPPTKGESPVINKTEMVDYIFNNLTKIKF